MHREVRLMHLQDRQVGGRVIRGAVKTVGFIHELIDSRQHVSALDSADKLHATACKLCFLPHLRQVVPPLPSGPPPHSEPYWPCGDDCVSSSGESMDSADEVEANLILVGEKSARSVSRHLKFPFFYTNKVLGKTSLTLSQRRPLPTQTLLQTLTLTVGERMMPQKGRLWSEE
jgi:hypothetical protein